MPSPFEKLQRYIRLESERGYDNRAVVGGLDKIIPWWEPEARANAIAEESLQAILERLRTYPKEETDGRQRLVIELNQLLDGLGKLPRQNPVPARPQPARPTSQPDRSKRPGIASQSERNDQSSDRQNRQTPRPAHPQQSRVPSAPLPASDALDQGLKAPVTVLQGIGPSNAKTLSTIGLNTLDDLLHYYPRRYDDYSKMKPINRLSAGEVVTILAAVKRVDNRSLHGGKREITEAILDDGTGALRVTWFNQPWLASRLRVGTKIVVSG